MEHALRCLGEKTWVSVLCLGALLAASFGSTAASLDSDEFDPRITTLQHTWDDAELSAEELAFDSSLQRRRTVSAEAAAADVQRLFYLFAHGYSGYAFFADPEVWQEARARILVRLQAREDWHVKELPKLFREELPFVRDVHTSIGGVSFGGHRDFWFAKDFEFREEQGAYRFDHEGESWTLAAIDDGDPASRLVPSLSAEGELVHRIGLTSLTAPHPVVLRAVAGERTLELKVALDRSAFTHYSKEVFRQDRIGGLPVLRVRSFSDHYDESLQGWVETAAALRGESVVVLDVRGNGGGNERYPIDWLQGLTGARIGSGLVFSELKSRTTMAGRANAFRSWVEISPKSSFLRKELESHLDMVESFGPGGNAPYWSGPFFSGEQTIPNETTVVIVTNGLVGSAGEGLVMRASRLENVVVVGENTRGALTFGNISLHQLPNSGLEVWLPINFNLSPDLVFREEIGLEPDYWVPAEDAVNHAVAAIRRGTISTLRALPEEVFQEELVFEDPDHLRKRRSRWQFVAGGLGAIPGLVFAFFLRKKPRNLLVVGALWVTVGVIWLQLARTKLEIMLIAAPALITFGVVWLFSGLVLRLQASRRLPKVR